MGALYFYPRGYEYEAQHHMCHCGPFPPPWDQPSPLTRFLAVCASDNWDIAPIVDIVLTELPCLFSQSTTLVRRWEDEHLSRETCFPISALKRLAVRRGRAVPVGLRL